MAKFMAEWDHANDPVQNYGTTGSYERAANFLDPFCEEVEDWGCGKGAARPYFSKTRYIGIDGSGSKHADKVVDLRDYHSETDGILIRHVLEHNYDWPLILRNAVESFRKRMCLVFFLEPEPYTRLWLANPSGVPNLHIGRKLLLSILEGLEFREDKIPRNDSTPHKAEYLFYVERK